MKLIKWQVVGIISPENVVGHYYEGLVDCAIAITNEATSLVAQS